MKVRDEDDLSTDRWPQVQRSSGVMQAVKPPIDLPPLPQSSSEDSLLAPLPPIVPRADSAAPLPDLDSPFEQRLARGSGPHPSYLGLPAQSTQVTPRLAQLVVTPRVLVFAGLWCALASGVAAWAGTTIAMGRYEKSAPVLRPPFLSPPPPQTPAPPPPVAAAPAPKPAKPVPVAPPPVAKPAPVKPPPAPVNVAAPPLAANGCPKGMEKVDGKTGPFCIDRFEQPGPNEAPITGVSRDEARRLCAGKGQRLCTGAEWEKACRGTKGASYPYGPSFAPGRCNVKGQKPEPTGSYDECRSASGAFDMSGNVAEWVDDGWPRGGSAIGGHDGRCSRPVKSPPSGRSPDMGFRCCADL